MDFDPTSNQFHLVGNEQDMLRLDSEVYTVDEASILAVAAADLLDRSNAIALCDYPLTSDRRTMALLQAAGKRIAEDVLHQTLPHLPEQQGIAEAADAFLRAQAS